MVRILARVVALGVALLASYAEVRAAEYDVEVVGHQLPSIVTEHAVIDVPLVLRNRGSRTWDPAMGFHVSYHWLSAEGERLVWDGERTPLPAVVKPGEQVALKVRLRVPPGSGVKLLQWDVVHESVAWLSERDPSPVPGIRVSVQQGKASHAFSIAGVRMPRVIEAGREQRLRVVIRNDGADAWGPPRPIDLAYHWHHRDKDRAVFEGVRAPVNRRVAPGESITIDAIVHVPSRPGVYRMQWDMVEEGVTWFADRDPSDEPKRLFLIVPLGLTTPAGIAFLASLLFLAFAIVALRVRVVPLILAATACDILWLATALILKSHTVVTSIPLPPGGSFWLASLAALLLMIVTVLLPRGIRPWAALAINALASALFLADLLHLRFFGDVISVASSGSAGQVTDVLASAASLWSPADIWFLLDLVPGIGIALAVHHLLKRPGTEHTKRTALVLVPLLVPGMVMGWQMAEKRSGPLTQVFQNVYVARDLGLLNYHAWDAWVHVREHVLPRKLPDERRAEIEGWFRAQAPRRAGVGPSFGAARGKNLVMLQVESLQAFVVGLKVDGQEVTPNLNRLKESGSAWFAECADQTMQGRTSDGEFTTQTSLLPLKEGAVAFRFGTNDHHAVADILASRGYQTLSAVPFDASFWNRRVTHAEYGFRTTFFGDSFAPGIRVGWGLNDREFLLQMVPRLAAMRRPFAALLITLSNHHPYNSFPDELKRMKLGRREGTPIGNYLHSMHHFDAALGEFLLALEQRGLARETVVAVWGDHVAGFPWNAELAQLIGSRQHEPDFLSAERVPLMLITPGGTPGSTRVPCGQVDVAPTLLALLGIDPALQPLMGRNLLGNPGSEPVVQRFGSWYDRDVLFMARGARLEDGHCYAAATLQRLPPDRCRDGYQKMRTAMEISSDVIEHDLHVALAQSLGQTAQPGARQ